MREILFRAKRLDNGEWVEGNLFQSKYPQNKPRSYIGYEEVSGEIGESELNYISHEVDPETVCQFTGSTDKNGNKIFEHDRLSNGNEFIATVVYSEGCFCLKKHDSLILEPLKNFKLNVLEVIGNIFDTAKILQSEK